MRLVFCGTPQFAVPTLEALHGAGHEIALVVSQPDRPRGRGMEVQVTPVKQKALHLGLKITQPEKIKNNNEFQAQLEAISNEIGAIVKEQQKQRSLSPAQADAVRNAVIARLALAKKR